MIKDRNGKLIDSNNNMFVGSIDYDSGKMKIKTKQRKPSLFSQLKDWINNKWRVHD